MVNLNEHGISLVGAITALTGRNNQLRTGKPKNNGAYAYLWRMVRFHTGMDVTMPMMCFFDLQNWLDSIGRKDVKVSGILNADGKALCDELDKMIDEISVHFKKNPYAGAMVWGKALGYVR